jgi:DNA repair exonuclease SbcCD ATPase subunit
VPPTTDRAFLLQLLAQVRQLRPVQTVAEQAQQLDQIEQTIQTLIQKTTVASVSDRYQMAELRRLQQDLQPMQTQLQHSERDKQMAIAERDQYQGRLQAIESSNTKYFSE